MSDTFKSLIDDLAVDQSPEPDANEPPGPTMGLVVGPALSEKEFSSLYSGKQGPHERIVFESEDGTIETATLRRGTEP
jgi:hypothetical protein